MFFLVVVFIMKIISGKLLLYICKLDYNKGYLLCTPPSDIELGALFPRPIIIPEFRVKGLVSNYRLFGTQVQFSALGGFAAYQNGIGIRCPIFYE